MFRWFQQTWPSIDHTTYDVASDYMFDSHISRTNGAILQGILGRAASKRRLYKEFLQMSLIFFGSEKRARVSFYPPGASHHALWMAKVIYNIKIFMFHQQFSLTVKENQSLKETVLFVNRVGLYIRFRHEEPLANRAPLNDLNLNLYYLRSSENIQI